MKLSHLSLAVLSAIALAACGGSSNGVQTTPDQNNTGNTGGTTGGNTGDTGGTTGGNTGDTGGTTGGNTGNTGGTTGGNTGDTGGNTGGNTGNTGGTTGGNTGDTGGNTDDQNDTDDGSTGGNTDDGNTGDGSTGDGSTGDGSTGDGSTGDGSTGDGSTGDGSTGDGSTGDGSTGDGSTPALSNDVVASLSNNRTALPTHFVSPAVTAQFPGQSAATTSVNTPRNTTAAQLLNLSNSKAYIKNPDLYNSSGNLDAYIAADAGQSAEVGYLDDSGNFQFAIIAQSAASQPFRYYKNASPAGTPPAADFSNPLDADDLYQIADLINSNRNVTQEIANAPAKTGQAAGTSNTAITTAAAGVNSLTDVTGFKVFDQAFAKPASGATQFATIDRSNIKVGEIIDSPVYAQVQYTAAKIAPITNGTATRRNVTQADSDGDAVVLQETKDIQIGHVKAYNLPHSLTTVSAYNNGPGVGPYFQANYTAQNTGAPVPPSTSLTPSNSVVQVTGLRTLDLPQSATATYTGKVFSADSKGDLSLDVEFGTTNSAYVKNVKITNRSDSANSSLKSMVGEAPAAVNYAGNGNGFSGDDYLVNLVAEDGINPTNPEYQSIGGKFYGPNAEETAGAVYRNRNGSNVINQVTGAFAAQRGELNK